MCERERERVCVRERERCVCERESDDDEVQTEQPYSDYRDRHISPALTAQREPYLPIMYPWRRERESE